MTRSAIALPCLALAGLLAAAAAGPRLRAEGSPPVADVRFVTLDPGHFHAALVQKEMYPGVARRVDVYAPLGSDLVDEAPMPVHVRDHHPDVGERERRWFRDGYRRGIRERR